MSSVSRLALLGAVAATLGGCVAYKPSPLDPRAELAALRELDLRLLDVTRTRPGNGESSPSRGFDLGDGLSEAELAGVALTLSPALRSQRMQVGAAQAALITAGQWPNPEVGVGLRAGIDGSSGYAAQLDALVQLLRPGERDTRKLAAVAGAEQADAALIAAEYELVAEVRQQRVAVLAAERVVALLQEAVELRQRSSGFVKERRQIGEATELESVAAELDLAEARRELRQAVAERDVAAQELNRLLGLPPDYRLALTGLGEPLAVTVFEDVADDELDRRLLAGRFDLRAKEAEYRRSEQALRLEVLQQYPRLGLGPSFERELEGDTSLGLGLSLELPLLNQNQGPIAEARAKREQVRAEYGELVHRLRAEAFAARAALRVAKAEVDAQEAEVLPVLRRNQDLFERAYRARELNIIDLITAQQRAVNARRENLDALIAYRRALIRLEASTGQPLSSPTTVPTTQSTNRSQS